MPDTGPVSLGDAIAQFQVRHNSKGGMSFQQELQRFVRWYGRDRDLSGFAPWEMESFGQSGGADSVEKLAPVKAFLGHAYKEGMTSTNLGNHLKVKRGPAQKQARRTPSPTAAHLSKEGHQRLQNDLDALKEQRLAVAEEIRRAMADKDFRENAPLDAARDQQAHLEARIRELEQTLRRAVIVEETDARVGVAKTSRVGSRVVVHDLEAGEEITYTLVDPNEVDLGRGKISIDSPAGKAFLGKAGGDTVEVLAPGGRLQYRIERVES